MNPSGICFVVPAHGRLEIARVCLRQLRRTCDVLERNGHRASAVVVSDDENLDLAVENGFSTVRRDNAQLGRRVNDGYQTALDIAVNPYPFAYAIPLGNDDWIDPHWILLPMNGETVMTHLSTVVNEDCTRMSYLDIRFGDGVRVYSRRTLQKVGFRPAEEHRKRAIDASTHNGTRNLAETIWRDTHSLAIVDFKSAENLNGYEGCRSHYGGGRETSDVWDELAKVYPAEAISEMQAVHGLVAA